MAERKLPQGLEEIVLALLVGNKEMYGLELVAKSEGKLGRNSVYVLLTRMVARGYLSSRYETDEERNFAPGPKRHLYKMSAYGQQMYAAKLAADRAAERVIGHQGVVKPKGAL